MKYKFYESDRGYGDESSIREIDFKILDEKYKILGDIGTLSGKSVKDIVSDLEKVKKGMKILRGEGFFKGKKIKIEHDFVDMGVDTVGVYAYGPNVKDKKLRNKCEIEGNYSDYYELITFEEINKLMKDYLFEIYRWEKKHGIRKTGEGDNEIEFTDDEKKDMKKTMENMTDEEWKRRCNTFSEFEIREREIYLETYGKEYKGADLIEYPKTGIVLLSDSAYSKDKENVYFCKSIIEKSDANTFKLLNNNYSKDKNNVYYRGEIIENLNPKYFKVFTEFNAFEEYGTDGKYICKNGRIMKGIDFKSFEILNFPYSKDKNNIYYDLKVLNLVDVQTFTIIDSFFSYDKNNFFYDNKIIEQIDYNTFELLKFPYSKDKNHIFKNGEIFNDVDYETFKIIGDSFTLDKNGLYYWDEKVEGVDLVTLKILEYGYFKDKNKVYNGIKILEGVDVETFKVLNRGYNKDKKNIFYREDKIEGVDIDSFEIFVEEELGDYGKDKNNIYLFGKKIEGKELEEFNNK